MTTIPLNRNSVTKAVEALLTTNSRKATVYQHPRFVVKATRRHKPNRRYTTVEMVLTVGMPNYAERKFIKACLAAREPFPVRKVQLKPYKV